MREPDRSSPAPQSHPGQLILSTATTTTTFRRTISQFSLNLLQIVYHPFPFQPVMLKTLLRLFQKFAISFLDFFR